MCTWISIKCEWIWILVKESIVRFKCVYVCLVYYLVEMALYRQKEKTTTTTTKKLAYTLMARALFWLTTFKIQQKKKANRNQELEWSDVREREMKRERERARAIKHTQSMYILFRFLNQSQPICVCILIDERSRALIPFFSYSRILQLQKLHSLWFCVILYAKSLSWWFWRKSRTFGWVSRCCA